MKTILTTAIVTAAALCGANAALLYSTDFNDPTYADGNLVGQDGWVNHSGSGSLVQVSETGTNGKITVIQGGGSREDVSHDLGIVLAAGGSLMAEFDVTIMGTADATTTYFMHFNDGGTGFNSRVFVTTPNIATQDFTFAIGETSSSTPSSIFATDFDYDTEYHLIVTYDFDTGISVLDVGGSTVNSTSQADPGEDLGLVSFRQSGGNTSTMIDNLTVSGVVPEPSSSLLLSLAGLAFLRRRRR